MALLSVRPAKHQPLLTAASCKHGCLQARSFGFNVLFQKRLRQKRLFLFPSEVGRELMPYILLNYFFTQ